MRWIAERQFDTDSYKLESFDFPREDPRQYDMIQWLKIHCGEYSQLSSSSLNLFSSHYVHFNTPLEAILFKLRWSD